MLEAEAIWISVPITKQQSASLCIKQPQPRWASKWPFWLASCPNAQSIILQVTWIWCSKVAIQEKPKLVPLLLRIPFANHYSLLCHGLTISWTCWTFAKFIEKALQQLNLWWETLQDWRNECHWTSFILRVDTFHTTPSRIYCSLTFTHLVSGKELHLCYTPLLTCFALQYRN